MLTKTDTIKRTGAWILVPAVALITATACGGVEEGDLAGIEQGRTDVNDVIKLDLPEQAPQPQLDPGARPQLPTPAYVKDQVLELCNGGAMTVKNDDALSKQLAGDLTVELWLRAENVEDHQQLMSADGLTVAIEQGRIRVELAEHVLQGSKLTSSTWHHVALVVTGNQALLYTDGTPSARLAVHNSQKPRGPVVFGGDAARGRPYCGKLDNVRVTGQALYLGSFTPAQQLKLLDSMVLGYDFDDLLGTKVEDLSGNGYHARLTGEASLVPGAI